MPRKLDLSDNIAIPTPTTTTIRLAHKTELLKAGWTNNRHCCTFYNNYAQDSIVPEMYDTCWEKKRDIPIEMFIEWLENSPNNNHSGYTSERIISTMTENPTNFHLYIPDFCVLSSKDFPFYSQRGYYLTEAFIYSLWMFRVGSYSDKIEEDI